ncbi:DUF423 domain-containing protein [uncultured Neptuniibacter sp.]|uniref:DUF423 domain-containing protein n=1 Tax=uncultured Neptuniibacter sp. TaxID=502143 RepID=UPI002631F1AD|nr:DUF423 domain-containing protein [uncultured Neptuniibacter sp.]
MNQNSLLLAAGLSGFIAVVLGAFGAHALKPGLSPALYTVYQTAVEYQFYHTGALGLIAMAPAHFRISALLKAGVAFVVGILLFSGSLYLMALTGIRSLGMVTPIGGVAFLIGWGLVAYTAIVSNRR